MNVNELNKDFIYIINILILLNIEFVVKWMTLISDTPKTLEQFISTQNN